MLTPRKDKIQHPYEKESFTDTIMRFVQEMDYSGQELARKIVMTIQILSAVSDRNSEFDLF